MSKFANLKTGRGATAPKPKPKEPSTEGPAGSKEPKAAQPEPKAPESEKKPEPKAPESEKKPEPKAPESEKKPKPTPSFSLDQLQTMIKDAVTVATSELRKKVGKLETALAGKANSDDVKAVRAEVRELAANTPGRDEYDQLVESFEEVEENMEKLTGPDGQRITGMVDHYNANLEVLVVTSVLDCDAAETVKQLKKLVSSNGKETLSATVDRLLTEVDKVVVEKEGKPVTLKIPLLNNTLSMERHNETYLTLETEDRYKDAKAAIDQEAALVKKAFQLPEIQAVFKGDD